MTAMMKWRKHALRTGLLGAAMVVVSAVPALAVVDNVECNWLGYNCRGFWDHGYTSTTVWSNFKQRDVYHGSSVFGKGSDGASRTNDSGCKPKDTWSYASLINVTSNRQAYYRDC